MRRWTSERHSNASWIRSELRALVHAALVVVAIIAPIALAQMAQRIEQLEAELAMSRALQPGGALSCGRRT